MHLCNVFFSSTSLFVFCFFFRFSCPVHHIQHYALLPRFQWPYVSFLVPFSNVFLLLSFSSIDHEVQFFSVGENCMHTIYNFPRSSSIPWFYLVLGLHSLYNFCITCFSFLELVFIRTIALPYSACLKYPNTREKLTGKGHFLGAPKKRVFVGKRRIFV